MEMYVRTYAINAGFLLLHADHVYHACLCADSAMKVTGSGQVKAPFPFLEVQFLNKCNKDAHEFFLM